MMMIIKLSLSFIFAFALAFIFFIPYRKELSKDPKRIYIIFVLAISSVLLIHRPIDFLQKFIQQEKILIYEAKLKEVITSETTAFYIDVFYDSDPKMAHVISYDGINQKKDWLTFDLTTKKLIHREDFSKASLNHFENSPYEKIGLKQDDVYSLVSNAKTLLYKTGIKRPWSIDSIVMLAGNEWTLAKDGFYFTKKEGDFLSIYKTFFEKSKKTEEKVSPEGNALYFNPVYWKNQEALLYLEVKRENDLFTTSLILQKDKNEAIAKYLSKSADFDLHPYKMVFNNKNLLAMVDGKSNAIKFFDMTNYPFKETSNEDIKFSRYKYGYDIALKNISKIFSLSFNPKDPNDFLVLGVPEGRTIPQLFHYNLVPSEIQKYPLPLLDYILAVIFLLIFFAYGGLYYYMARALFR